MWFLRQRAIAGLAVVAWACALVLPVRPGAALPLAMTKEYVQKKAVIIKNDAKLYARSSGSEGKKVKFMDIFFLLVGEANGRVPVAEGPNQEEPDGWLEKSSFSEWNTLQMINFEPQSGRKLASIFKDAGCAESFGLTGVAGSSCPELGAEPQRTGRQTDSYRLLVPVMQSEGGSYQGGFVRVTAEGPAVRAQPDAEAGTRTRGTAPGLGYDLVLVVDSTASMEQWFRPTTEALDSFISTIKRKSGGEKLTTPFRVGLLFYRDRKIAKDCDIGFLTHWASDLTDNISEVNRALAGAQKAECGSDEEPEAVYDALSRAIQDPRWNDGHFKVVLLVGDAPPHAPSSKDKNPMGLDFDFIAGIAEERNVRIMTFKIGLVDEAEFKALALSVKEEVRGRYRAIAPDPQAAAYKAALLSALDEEWKLLMARNEALQKEITKEQAQDDQKIFEKKGIDVSQYDIPIIIANLPSGSAGSRAPEFVQGWVPKKINKKLAVGEYVFMAQGPLKRLISTLEFIERATLEGRTEGGEAFIKSLRSSLATVLNVQPEDLFRSGESLGQMIAKARILPFKTTVLSFTAAEVVAWKPGDFERINRILSEKITALRQYSQNPNNLHFFGDKPHVYVPRDLFP